LLKVGLFLHRGKEQERTDRRRKGQKAELPRFKPDAHETGGMTDPHRGAGVTPVVDIAVYRRCCVRIETMEKAE